MEIGPFAACNRGSGRRLNTSSITTEYTAVAPLDGRLQHRHFLPADHGLDHRDRAMTPPVPAPSAQKKKKTPLTIVRMRTTLSDCRSNGMKGATRDMDTRGIIGQIARLRTAANAPIEDAATGEHRSSLRFATADALWAQRTGPIKGQATQRLRTESSLPGEIRPTASLFFWLYSSPTNHL